jgi:hypothetical protein
VCEKEKEKSKKQKICFFSLNKKKVISKKTTREGN